MFQLVCDPDQSWIDHSGKHRSAITSSSFYKYYPGFELHENFRLYAASIGLTLIEYCAYENVEEEADMPLQYSKEYMHDWKNAYWVPSEFDTNNLMQSKMAPILLRGIVNYAKDNNATIMLCLRGEDMREYI